MDKELIDWLIQHARWTEWCWNSYEDRMCAYCHVTGHIGQHKPDCEWLVMMTRIEAALTREA